MHKHPYFPTDLQLPAYVPNTLSASQLIPLFAISLLPLAVLTYFFLLPARASKGDKLVAVWLCVSGSIHSILELYYVISPSAKLLADTSILGQIWKEYAHSDSRYLTGDGCVWSIEALTAFIVGPLCFVCVYAIREGRGYRHPLQLLISTCQLYGCVVYYMTAYLNGMKESNPSLVYVVGYFVFMNMPWILIPASLIWQSFGVISGAMSSQKVRGSPRKKE